MDVQRQKSGVATLSVISNSLLVAGKLIVGLAIGSVSIISEAIHSGVDLLAAVIALFAVNTSHKPADKEHPFGHGKVENISGTVEALLIFLAAGWIIYEAAGKLLHPREIEAVGWGVVVMFVSSLVNIIVSKRLFKVGRATCSVALQADAWHLRTDVYTSAGVMAGLVIILAGGKLFPGVNLLWLDPLAAIAVALLIIRAAWHLTLESAKDLLDVSLPQEETWIREYIARLAPLVRGIHHLHTRKSGALRFVEFHLIVEQNLSVVDSHRLTDIIDDDIETHFPGTRTTIHVEPCDGTCDQTCLGGCLVDSDRDISATDNRSKPE